jgi:predicted GNAT superfamily acetyltransferase
MSPTVRRKKSEEIKMTISPFRGLADYKSCVDIQREVWRFEDMDIYPIGMLIAAQNCGGIALGAYNSIGEMIGFVFSILSMEEGGLAQHSLLLAVRQAYRNFNVAYKLKLAQRKECLKRKIKTIAWEIDPMQPLNAFFTLGKLGATANAYVEDFHGESTSVLHRGLPTDRFVVRWNIEANAVEERIESGSPRHDLRKELKRYKVINRLEDVAPGMTISSPLKLNSTEDRLLFEIPYNLPEIKNRDLGIALEWQGKLRQAFRHYFNKDYSATDFWVAEEEGHLRAFYFLEKKSKHAR